MIVPLGIIFNWSVMIRSTKFHDFCDASCVRAKGPAHIVTRETTKTVQTDLLSDPANQLLPL